jgi:hypothetical protein
MPRHLGNMKRLCMKLELRYGADDPLVVQLKRELELLAVTETDHPHWSTPYPEFIKGGASNRGHPSGGAMTPP